MMITMIGTGYVGLVTGACLADWGHQVVCADKDAGKIADLLRGMMQSQPGPGATASVAATHRGRIRLHETPRRVEAAELWPGLRGPAGRHVRKERGGSVRLRSRRLPEPLAFNPRRLRLARSKGAGAHASPACRSRPTMGMALSC